MENALKQFMSNALENEIIINEGVLMHWKCCSNRSGFSDRSQLVGPDNNGESYDMARYSKDTLGSAVDSQHHQLCSNEHYGERSVGHRGFSCDGARRGGGGGNGHAGKGPRD